MTKKLIETIEDHGWRIYFGKNFISLSKYSPLGEDFSIDVLQISNDHSISKEIFEIYQGFDPEAHAYGWYKNCEHSLKDLLEDAEYIKEDMLKPLAFDLFKMFDEFFGKENESC